MITKFLKRNEGAALIEFAIVTSIFFSVLIVTFELGLICSIKNGLKISLAEGARLGAMGRDLNNVQSIIKNKYSIFGIGTISDSNITITSYPNMSDLINNTNGQNGTGNPGDFVLYKVQSNYTFISSYLLPQGITQILTATTVVKNEEF